MTTRLSVCKLGCKLSHGSVPQLAETISWGAIWSRSIPAICTEARYHKPGAAHLKLDALCRGLVDAAEGILAQILIAYICTQQHHIREVQWDSARPSLSRRAHSKLAARG